MLLINLRSSKVDKIDQSKYSVIHGFNWSPDGKYIAYECSIDSRRTAIKIYDTTKKEVHTITNPVRHDFAPVFDSEGKYLAFLSGRIYNPVYDPVIIKNAKIKDNDEKNRNKNLTQHKKMKFSKI